VVEAQGRLIELDEGGLRPRYYPDHVAISHTTSEALTEAGLVVTGLVHPTTSLGLPGLPGAGVQFGLDGAFYPVRESADRVEEAGPVPEAPYNQGRLGVEVVQLELRCPGFALIGECEEEHFYGKGVICNREWCEERKGRCGGIDGPAHQRRKARWIPKARKIGDMGHFVLTLPPEVRHHYRTQKTLGQLGTSAKRMFQRHGYQRGLRRWHLFGEDHPGHGLQGDGMPPFHPHLEVLVDGGWLRRKSLGDIKRSWANILKVPVHRINIHYEYIPADDIKRKLHRVSYALRPTFIDCRWDPELAYELIGFHNAQTWGSKEDWAGPDLWDVPEDASRDAPGAVLEALEVGRCPIDGTPITWLGLRPVSELVEPGWAALAGGYWRFDGLARDGPGEVSCIR